MPETMQGRRVPDSANQKLADWQTGDYGRVCYGGDRWYWFIRDPHGQLGNISGHQIVEHEDGTITVSPSILDPDPGGWHGYLEHGVWRSV